MSCKFTVWSLQPVKVAVNVQRMSPITAECPKVLLPLVNAPLIEYMLEWMAMSGVQKVHVLCCSHADQVRTYLNKSTKWAASDMTLNIISSYNCQSAGEALRLVDQEGLIQDDFILISGDVVTNMDLSRALAQHKARRCAQSTQPTHFRPQCRSCPCCLWVACNDVHGCSICCVDLHQARLMREHTPKTTSCNTCITACAAWSWFHWQTCSSFG